MFFKGSRITQFWGYFKPPKICLRKDFNFSHVCDNDQVNGVDDDILDTSEVSERPEETNTEINAEVLKVLFK